MRGGKYGNRGNKSGKHHNLLRPLPSVCLHNRKDPIATTILNDRKQKGSAVTSGYLPRGCRSSNVNLLRKE
ncbi:MAG: hypothetical protein [Olavius algarvensis Delta 4 endosymbiont]|nr:MAG: hypothetical protein [Olavius algarvensis Delta 4 endosymbiont]